MTAVYIVLAMVFVLMNGFFVLVEFSLVKIRRTKLEELISEGKRKARAQTALAMHKQMDEYLSATQLGITVASLGLGWIGKPAFSVVFEFLFNLGGAWGEAISASASMLSSFMFITFLHVLIGELAPKSIAIQNAESSIMWAAPLMRVFYWIFIIPLTILTKASNWIISCLGLKPTSETETAVSEEELRHVLAYSHRTGEFSLDRLLLFENMLDLSDLTVGQIMLPISQVDTYDLQRSWEENLEIIREKRHSRLPISKGSTDEIVGMLHIKDLGTQALGEVGELNIEEFQRDVFAVKDTLLVETLLREFQRRRQHLAIVQDYNGRNVGMVTLEDLLEELVGEIVDEFDVGAESPLSLADFTGTNFMHLDLTATNARGAIREMLSLLEDVPDVESEEALEAIMRRERDAPTGLGKGIAVPHARLPNLSRPYVVFARCKSGVDFRASDGLPAHVIFLILSPQSAPILQVKLVARIAGLVQSGYLTTQLQEAETSEDVMNIIRAADVAATL